MKNLLAKVVGKSVPKQFAHTRLTELPLLAVDFEFSSLNKKEVKFMSAGWVEGHNYQIDFNQSYYRLIRAKGDLQQSPIIHGLTARDIARGVHVKEMYSALMPFAQTHVWVLHNAELDLNMLKELAFRFGEVLPNVTTIDTMQIALYKLQKGNYAVANDAATLEACRKRYELSESPMHNSLSDAQATLELFYAQIHKLDPKSTMTLSDLKASSRHSVKVF